MTVAKILNIEIDVEDVRKQMNFETTKQAQQYLDFALPRIKRCFKRDKFWDEFKCHIKDYHQENGLMDNENFFCPRCEKQNVCADRGIFVEVGTYDEHEQCCEEEWNTHERVCLDCGTQFVVK